MLLAKHLWRKKIVWVVTVVKDGRKIEHYADRRKDALKIKEWYSCKNVDRVSISLIPKRRTIVP